MFQITQLCFGIKMKIENPKERIEREKDFKALKDALIKKGVISENEIQTEKNKK